MYSQAARNELIPLGTGGRERERSLREKLERKEDRIEEGLDYQFICRIPARHWLFLRLENPIAMYCGTLLFFVIETVH